MNEDNITADKGDNNPKGENKLTPLVNKYLARIRRLIPPGKGKQYAYRGQGNYEWELESTASQRYGKKPTQAQFIEYNCNLVDEAKDANYHLQENNKLADIEMLAELRHYNAATALIDFTRDFLVALWFACERVKKDDGSGKWQPGKIFIVQTDDIEKFLQLRLKDKEKTLEDILKFQTRKSDKKPEEEADKKLRIETRKSELWYWEPRFEINHRLSSQRGVFIFGKPVLSPKDTGYKEVEIEPDDKDPLRSELDTFFGISEASLFNDLHGFAEINAAKHEASPETTVDYLKKGNEYFQQGELEKAIKQYDEAIKLEIQSADAYAAKGTTELQLGQQVKALNDLNQAIKLNPQNIIARHSRGVVQLDLGQHKKALADFDWIIGLDPQKVEAYSARGAVKWDLGRHNEALADLNQAIRLDSQNVNAHIIRGSFKLQIKRHNEALADLKQALKLATEQGDKESAQLAQQALDNLPPSSVS